MAVTNTATTTDYDYDAFLAEADDHGSQQDYDELLQEVCKGHCLARVLV